ncbi:MAG: pilus assembly FimT family protein [Phycisphaerales bacterium]
MKNEMKPTTQQEDMPRRRMMVKGFTLIELLVVIAIGVIILTIAVPAFQSMSYSTNRSMASNALTASTRMARDVAINSGRDGAVVFVYDPQVGKMQIIPAVYIGTIREITTVQNLAGMGMGLSDTPYFDRDVFVPATQGEVLEMPNFWMVRGYAGPGSLIDYDSAGDPATTWYTSNAYGGITNNPINDPIKNEAHWVFPETGFFAVNAQVAGGDISGGLSPVDYSLPTPRQSFMVRFDARTGAVSRSTNTALFVDPRNSRERPYGDRPTLYQQTLRVDMAEDIATWASRVIESPDLTNDGIAFGRNDEDLRVELLGIMSNDTILVKPVTRLSLYDERRLAIALGARGLNKETQTIYAPADQQNSETPIEFDAALFSSFDEAEIVRKIDQWVDGDTNFDDTLDLDDEPETRVYLIQSYTGELQEVLR